MTGPSPSPRALVAAETAPLWQALAEIPDLSDPASLARVRRAHPEVDGGLVAAIATQVALQRRARDRLGDWSQRAIWDDEAVQQASRDGIARYRAERMAARWPSARRVADLGCGVGTDSHALAQVGFDVVAFEIDPWRAEAARINLASDGVTVVCADVTAPDIAELHSCDIAYVDPARRQHRGPRRVDGRRSHPLSDPQSWSPPWSWVRALSDQMPVVAKVAPGFDPRRAPPGADIEWLDDDAHTVEATIWMGGGDHAGERRATALWGHAIDTIALPAGTYAPGPTTSTAAGLLIEPTPAVVRAGLVGALAERLGAASLDGGTWLTGDRMPSTTLAHAWRVIEEVPHGARDLRAWLRGRGSVTWKTAQIGMSAAEWDRRVGHRPRPARQGRPGRPVEPGPATTVVITGAGDGAARAFAVEPATSAGE